MQLICIIFLLSQTSDTTAVIPTTSIVSTSDATTVIPTTSKVSISDTTTVAHTTSIVFTSDTTSVTPIISGKGNVVGSKFNHSF